MALRFYNTLSREKEEFKPIKQGIVHIYTCGPTVYNYAHIGNWRSYVFADLLRRYLKYKGYKVKQVMNLTDVDDKTIRDSQKEGISLKKFTEKYTEAFFEDLKKLNIELAEIFPKATDHIPEMIQIIKKLKEKGYTYDGEDGVYYRITKFKDYGKLAHIDLSQLKTGARVSQDEYDKENAADFVLWKKWAESDGPVYWETELGKGRPGWHIECSAMSTKYLGETFDIHTGGVDLIFPHHQNEIAQTEAATGKKFVNYWMHCEHLIVDGKKMAKSLGNFYTLRDVLNKGHDARSVRYALMATHYRQQLNFIFQSLDAAKNSLERLLEFMRKISEIAEGIEKGANQENEAVGELLSTAKQKFEEAMDDDLGISEALAAIFELVKEINTLLGENLISKEDAEKILKAMHRFDTVLGVLEEEKEQIPLGVLELAKQRHQARKEKNFELADLLRKKIHEHGYSVDDTADSFKMKKIR